MMNGDRNSFSIAVVIPTYNRAFCISSAIDTVLAQKHRPNEIIVVDDGSSDGTHDVVSTYGEAVRYIYQSNRGVSAARNKGIQAASSTWIAFLDSDDEWHEDKLALQVNDLRAHPDVIAHIVDCRIRQQGHADLSVYKIRGLLAHFSASPVRERPLKDVLASAFFPSAWMVRREVLVNSGGFSDELSVCEDTDLLSRIALRGKFFVNCFPGVSLERRDSSGGLSDLYVKSPISYFNSMRHTYRWLLSQALLTSEERGFVERELAAIHIELALLHARDSCKKEMRQEIFNALCTSHHPKNVMKSIALLVFGYRSYVNLVEQSGRQANKFRRTSTPTSNLS